MAAAIAACRGRCSCINSPGVFIDGRGPECANINTFVSMADLRIEHSAQYMRNYGLLTTAKPHQPDSPTALLVLHQLTAQGSELRVVTIQEDACLQRVARFVKLRRDRRPTHGPCVSGRDERNRST